MTNLPHDWRESAESSVASVLTDVIDTAESISDTTPSDMEVLEEVLLDDEVDRTDKNACIRTVEWLLVERAHQLLDAAYGVRQLRVGPTLRNLEGKEPIGYSKPDGGATLDAHYGMKSMTATFDREISWPLLLDGGMWECESTDELLPGGDYDPVTASGVKKYTMHAGSREVSVVLGEPEPPI